MAESTYNILTDDVHVFHSIDTAATQRCTTTRRTVAFFAAITAIVIAIAMGISLPVQTPLCPSLAEGAPVVVVVDQESVPGS